MKRLLLLLVFFGANLLFGQTAVLPAGDGTSISPYQIATLSNLYWITAPGTVDGLTQAARWTKSYAQTADIDAASTSGWNAGVGWSPIGNYSVTFSGTYDGGGHTISNLYMHRGSTDYQGFFGYTGSGAAIQNLGMVNVNVLGAMVTGSLAGASLGTISNCYGTGSVGGSRTTGGLVGYAVSGTISDCYAGVTVSSAGSNIGGFVGYLSSPGTINNCYSTGSAGGYSFVGGFIGYGYSTISNSFWDTQTSGNPTSAYGGTGKTTSQLKTQSTFLNAGWGSALWSMDAGINNGYPYLKWQNPGGSSLPIQLASFTASAIANNSVRLNWRTISEINNYGFYIQRRLQNDSLFTQVPNSFVAGHGTTDEPQAYSFAHANAGSVASQYRIQQVDLDGAIHFTEPISVSSPTSVAEVVPTEFSLKQNYPNPFNPMTTIGFDLPKQGHVRLEVFNALGQRVALLVDEVRNEGYYAERFDGNNLASGLYFYRLQAGDFVKTMQLLLLR